MKEKIYHVSRIPNLKLLNHIFVPISMLMFMLLIVWKPLYFLEEGFGLIGILFTNEIMIQAN